MKAPILLSEFSRASACSAVTYNGMRQRRQRNSVSMISGREPFSLLIAFPRPVTLTYIHLTNALYKTLLRETTHRPSSRARSSGLQPPIPASQQAHLPKRAGSTSSCCSPRQDGALWSLTMLYPCWSVHRGLNAHISSRAKADWSTGVQSLYPTRGSVRI